MPEAEERDDRVPVEAFALRPVGGNQPGQCCLGAIPAGAGKQVPLLGGPIHHDGFDGLAHDRGVDGVGQDDRGAGF